MSNIFNFSAGPAIMPKEVLIKAQSELLNWENLQASVMEVSHRGKHFIKLAEQSISDLRNLYNIPDNYDVLFAQGGARGQFAAVPMNLLSENGKALYITSGYWSQSAAKEARLFGNIDEINVVEKNKGIASITDLDFSKTANQYDYVHYCPNETISGIEIFEVPQVANAILVADMSSTILSRKIDISRFGIIYAGAQKNLGAAGITLLIIRNDLIGKARKATPSVWNYQILRDSDSMFNTPPTFAWYLCALIFQHWLAEGGLTEIEKRNRAKSDYLYRYLDQSNFYFNHIANSNRSLMNVTFTTNKPELDAEFIEQATAAQLYFLKGHRIAGGMRASLYNAMPIEGVEALVEFMRKFAEKNSKVAGNS